jgi:hypothetical protein
MNNTYINCARPWFDKKAGNSYYTFRVVCPDGKYYIIPKSYGHGEGTYINVARQILKAAGYREDDDTDFIVDEVKVSRMKDLHAGGLS